MKKNVIIIGAAGRDFHNFNTYFRGNENFKVVAFTAAQIPDIDGRKYPAELAGDLYPDGIPIFAEKDLPKLIKDLKVDDCVFSYSDVTYQKVMQVSAIVNAAGANFILLGPNDTMVAQKVQRFATVEDLHKHKCTVEEMEEYEPHVVRGNVIYELQKMTRMVVMLFYGMEETTIFHFINPI
jgi:predicted GTPase